MRIVGGLLRHVERVVLLGRCVAVAPVKIVCGPIDRGQVIVVETCLYRFIVLGLFICHEPCIRKSLGQSQVELTAILTVLLAIVLRARAVGAERGI